MAMRAPYFLGYPVSRMIASDKAFNPALATWTSCNPNAANSLLLMQNWKPTFDSNAADGCQAWPACNQSFKHLGLDAHKCRAAPFFDGPENAASRRLVHPGKMDQEACIVDNGHRDSPSFSACFFAGCFRRGFCLGKANCKLCAHFLCPTSLVRLYIYAMSRCAHRPNILFPLRHYQPLHSLLDLSFGGAQRSAADFSLGPHLTRIGLPDIICHINYISLTISQKI
jgi:hypothetical protein